MTAAKDGPLYTRQGVMLGTDEQPAQPLLPPADVMADPTGWFRRSDIDGSLHIEVSRVETQVHDEAGVIWSTACGTPSSSSEAPASKSRSHNAMSNVVAAAAAKAAGLTVDCADCMSWYAAHRIARSRG
jgi:hypothetical protein